MRVATELAFLVASVHSKTRVTSQAINSITFRKPVPIGSRLKLIGKVNMKFLLMCYNNITNKLLFNVIRYVIPVVE